MRRLFYTVLFLFILAAPPAFGQDATDKVPLTVTRAELQIIGQGLMELPYKTAVGPMNALSQQLAAHDAAAAAAKGKVPEEPKPEPKSDAKPPAN